MKQRISDVITIDEIEKWQRGNIITISASCGAGKSYFIKNTLYEYAKNHDKKILMLIHRKTAVEQFRMEIEKDDKTDVIDIYTYQLLDHQLKKYQSKDKDIAFDLSQYEYIICDEFHYFTADSRYNYYTDLSFCCLIEDCQDITRIFMSATGDEMERVLNKTLEEHKKTITYKYKLNNNFKHIQSLTFYNDDSIIDMLLTEWENKKEKAIVFLRSCTLAYDMHKKHEKTSMFLCSKYNKEFSGYVNEAKINKMLNNEKFDCNFLICTSCFDAGANIVDKDVKNIIVDIRDFYSLVQCVGRKRIIDDNDKINLYVKAYNNQTIGGHFRTTQKELEHAEYLLSHSVQEYVAHFGRQQDKTRTVYDFAKINKHKNTSTKNLNWLIYYKRKFDLARYSEMLNLGYEGYNKYVARYFDKYDIPTGQYIYGVLKENYTLEQYLQSIVNKVMYSNPDKQELIEKIDVRSNGKQLKSLNSLNSALEERKLNYRIISFKTSKIIDGKKKNFFSAWKIIYCGDSAELE